MKSRFQALPAILCILIAAPVAAQDYPSQPVKFVVPYAAGGAVDRLARLIGHEISADLGQSVVVENKPGAATAIGASTVVQSKADGYTLLIGTDTTMSLNPLLFKKLSYDPSKLQPVALLGQQPMLMVAPAEIPASSLKELVAHVKANPGKLNYASLGPGSVAHLMGEKFKSTAGIELEGIPYKGGVPAVADLIANRVQIYFDGISNSLPHVIGGKLKTFGTTGERRSANAPHIPTLAEQGYPSMTTYFWIGLFAPTGTPSSTIERLNAAVRKALAKPDITKHLGADGVETRLLSPGEFSDMVVQSRLSWSKVVAPLNLTLD